jgi:hypothetical protein
MLYLVSRDGLPVDRESVPLHLVTEEPWERVQALVREVVRQPGFWEVYGAWLAQLHANVWEEIQQMIRTLGTEPNLDLRPLIAQVGLKQVIDQVGLKQVLETVDVGEVIAALESDWFLTKLTPEQIQELKRRLP